MSDILRNRTSKKNTLYYNEAAGVDMFRYENPESPVCIRAVTISREPEVHERILSCIDPEVMDDLAVAWLTYRYHP